MFRPYDMHMHTVFSTDSETPMEAQAEAAISRGLAGIAITDHYNPDYPNPVHRTGQPTEAYHRAMEHLAEQYAGRLEVLKGIEMGILPGGTMDRCEAAARDYSYDFILASFHATPERTFDDLARDPASNVEAVFRQYYEFVLSCIGQFKNYDVLAHLNLVDRYAPYVPDDSLYTDVIDEILRTAVADGKGLEINTASWRYRMGERTTPTAAILKRFRELGGEYVTVGSDAHTPKWLGDHLEEGYQLLRDLGWKYCTVYRQRKPCPIKL